MAKEIIKILTPEEIAADQNIGDSQRLGDRTIEALANLIQLIILDAGYIPYTDHPIYFIGGQKD